MALRTGVLILAVLVCLVVAAESPNVILLMCDDLGYGDTGFNGNSIIKTPHLDEMAKSGAVLTNFHAGAAVCSPTRGTCLTGRHHYRYGIWSANRGHLPAQEITLAKMLKTRGYTTGHFGKWHLGTLSREFSAKGQKRNPQLHYAPPWERDYDRSFVTESAVATWDPATHSRYENNPYWDDGVVAKQNLKGDDSRVIMDRVLPFINGAVADSTPFLAVVWFHAPHVPVVAGPEYLAMYKGHGDAAHYYGCITAMDEQVGRLRERVSSLGIERETLILFCSDNGPEGKQPKGTTVGVTGGLRGRKRSEYEGGVRVPAFAQWIGRIQPGVVIDTPLSTLDYFPTIQELVGYEMPDNRPIDGVSILGTLLGQREARPPIPFRVAHTAGLIDGNFKLVIRSFAPGDAELYKLDTDRGETNSVAHKHPHRVKEMTDTLRALEVSASRSHAGHDYAEQISPAEAWVPLVRKLDDSLPSSPD